MASMYSRPFLASLGLHLGLLVLMLWHPEHSQAVLEADEHSKIAEQMAKSAQPAPIQAVAVDTAEVQEAMKKLQQQKDQAKRQEMARQRQLAQEAERAKQAKLAEMKRVEDLKKQADALKVEQEKMKKLAAENLKKLQQQKAEQEKQLAEIKKKQVDEAKRMEQQLAKQKEAELLKQQKVKAEAQAKAQSQAAEAKRAQEFADRQRMAGEVDRYKALILNAIRDRWILPENVDPGLSSQFVIRLAPTGTVMDVRLAKSSGDALLDRTAQAAIWNASPLPVPSDATTFNMFREITLTVRPSNARG